MEQINLAEAISKTKKLMDQETIDFSEFSQHSPFYFNTNENLKMNLGLLKFNKERALSIMASGDQTFNLIYLGVKHIDTFDVNALSYFIYHLRRAIFLAYGYENSIEIEDLFCLAFTNPFKLLEILKELKPFMDNDVYSYFEEVLNYNIFLYASKNYNSFCDLCRDPIISGTNLYNRNKNAFKKFQDNLEQATVTFRNCDIKDLPNTLEDRYDLMYFSNIAESYIAKYGKRAFARLMMRFYYSLNSNGLILNCYFDQEIFNYPFRTIKKFGWQGKTRVRTLNGRYAIINYKK